MKNRLPIILSLLILLTLTALLFSACGKETPFNGTNDELGIVLEGGGYDGTATLVASKVTEVINVKEVKEKLPENAYNTTAELFIYYINVLKDGKTLQPTGNVKITLPEPTADYTDYIVFHINGTDVETLTYTVADGKISFETSSFYYFVIAHSHVHEYTEWSDANDGENHTRSCACGYVGKESHNYDQGKNISAEKLLYTCQSCAHTYTHNHEYSGWLDAEDGENHVGYCSCGKISAKNHNYDQGVDTSTGTLYTCESCGYTKTISRYVSVNISIYPNNSVGSIVSINGVDYAGATSYSTQLEYGTELTVVIKAASNYTFYCWRSGDEELSKNTTYKFTVGKDKFTVAKTEINIIAEFNKKHEDGELPTPIV